MNEMRTRGRSLKLLAILSLLVLIAVLSRSLWLPLGGYILVHDEGPAKAEMAVVLAGDAYGHRIERAAQLAREGYVPAVLVDGPEGFYGVHECDLAIPFILREGFPAQQFIPLPMKTFSTQEEAGVVLDELERRHIKSILLVTSDYHTARSGRIFRALIRKRGGGPAVRVVAARDEFFQTGSWWRTRQGRKTAFMEWSKTIAEAVGL